MPRVLRITLDFCKKLDKRLVMEAICARISAEFEGKLRLWRSEDNADELVILVRIVSHGEVGVVEVYFCRASGTISCTTLSCMALGVFL